MIENYYKNNSCSGNKYDGYMPYRSRKKSQSQVSAEIDALLIKTRNSNSTYSNNTDTVAYYHHDHPQTPIQATDKAGDIVWAASYDAFGKASIITPAATALIPTIESNLRLPGQYEDQETGLHYNYFRYYDTQIGRYISQDPIGLGGGVNRFAYVNGDPINYIDPTGEIPLLIILPIISGVVNGLTNIYSAGKCDNKFTAFASGFVAGGTGTLFGLGATALTGNPYIGGMLGAYAGDLVNQSFNGSFRDINWVQTANAGVWGVFGAGAGGYFAKMRGFTPKMTLPRNFSNWGLNSTRMTAQEAWSAGAGAGGGEAFNQFKAPTQDKSCTCSI